MAYESSWIHIEVGDRVERLEENHDGLEVGDISTVRIAKIKPNDRYSLIWLEGYAYGFLANKFKITKKGKEKDMVKTDKMWEFNVLSDENIDFASIYNDLSYAQPLALIESKGDKHNFYAVIHHSVLAKAKALGLILDETANRMANGALVLESHADFGKAISGIKKIKNATWPENCRNEAKVTVILPKV